MTELLVAVVGGFVLGIMPGLYLGERGRRIDAQKREPGRPAIDPLPAVSRAPGEADVSAKDFVEGGPMAELTEAPDEWLRETMTETGCSRDEALEEWHRCLGKLPTGGEGVEWPATS